MAHQPPSDHTVLKFIHLQFDKNWTRHFPATIMFYTATATAQLLVVTEAVGGGLTTYFFRVRAGDDVCVSYDGQIVHVPARCVKAKRGDHTACARS
jgi:hypothetical protein